MEDFNCIDQFDDIGDLKYLPPSKMFNSIFLNNNKTATAIEVSRQLKNNKRKNKYLGG